MRLRYFRPILLAAIACIAADTAAAQAAADYNAQGVAHYNAGRWQEALDSFQAAYEISPDNATVRRNLCNAYQSSADELAKAGQLEAAAQSLEIAIGVDPENASPLVQLGAYYLRLGLAADAIFRLEEAVEIAPDNLDARDLLGDSYYHVNDLAAALAQWLAVQEVEPGRAGLAKKIEKANREDVVENRFRQSSSAHFEISFAPDTKPQDMRKLLMTLEQAYRDVGRKLGNAYPPSTVPVIIYTTQEFSDATALGDHVGAVYDGKIRTPVRDAKGAALPESEIRRRLYHEYTHVVVRALVEDHAPWWLNEGLAEQMSRDFSAGDKAKLRAAIDSKAWFAIESLEEQQLEKLDATALGLAYTQAHAVVNFLWTKYGQRNLRDMLDYLAAGESYEDALKAAYHRDYATLNREVMYSLRGD